MNVTTEFLVAVGAILGAVGAIVPHIIPWFRGREKLLRERKRIEFAKLEVDFISAWIAAASAFSGQEIEEKKSQAEKQLVQLLGPSEIISNKPQQESDKPRAGILVSIAFYGYLGFYLFLVFGASIDRSTNNPSITELLSEDNPILLLIFLVPLLILFFVRRRSKAKNIRMSNAA